MSKRIEVKLYKAVQFAFGRDCELFLQKFAELQTFSYSQFAKIWQEMSMSLVFTGKSSYDEFRHYTDIFLFECKKHHIYATNLYLKTGAFYLMYGLYYKQPIKCFVKIRFTKDEYQQFTEYINEMKNQNQVEPLYIYCKLMVDDAFDFVYTQTAFAPDLRHFYANFEMSNDTFEATTCDNIEAPLKKLLENRDIASIHSEYEKALSEYIGTHEGSNLMVFQNNILDDIKKIITDENKELEGTQESSTEVDIGQKREMLKRKAMEFKK